jgi:D-amino-acid dehydrogenase
MVATPAPGQTIAVIGAGIVGTSTALFLQADGHAVTLIDPLEPGAGTSSGNAGVISLASCMPIATPEVLKRLPAMLMDPVGPLSVRWAYLPRLLPWLARLALATRNEKLETTTAALAALLAEADRAHDVLIQRCGAGDLVHRTGWLKVATSREKLLAATRRDREAYARHGIEHRVLEEGESLALEPALREDLRFGLLLPQNRAVRHPQRYVERLARSFLAEGGRHLRTPAAALRSINGQVSAVETAAGPVEAEHVVIAAGAFSKRLAGMAGARLPLDAERGYHVMLPHPERTLTRPVYLVDHAFLLAPMEHGLRLTGGVELASPTAPPDFRRIRRLVPIACAALPGLEPSILSEWQGCRPSLPDSLPVIGRAPGRRNVWLAFGHQHIGLTLGPLTGRLIADLIAGRDPGLDLAPFRGERRYW